MTLAMASCTMASLSSGFVNQQLLPRPSRGFFSNPQNRTNEQAIISPGTPQNREKVDRPCAAIAHRSGRGVALLCRQKPSKMRLHLNTTSIAPPKRKQGCVAKYGLHKSLIRCTRMSDLGRQHTLNKREGKQATHHNDLAGPSSAYLSQTESPVNTSPLSTSRQRSKRCPNKNTIQISLQTLRSKRQQLFKP